MEKIKQSLRDSKSARWTALVIVSFTMLCGYFFTEIISPLKPMLEKEFGWSATDYGLVTSAYGFFNVFLFMLIIGGIILDRMGIRFSAILSGIIMVIGAGIKYYAFVGVFDPIAKVDLIFFEISTQVFTAAFGYAFFGIGIEIAGITVSKIIVKWFKGKELALAMGMEMACARLGTFAAMLSAPFIAEAFTISMPILLGLIALCIGLITFVIYLMMDIKLDKELAANNTEEEEEPFRIKDIGFIITNRGFWYIAILCVLFYSAVFPFYKYGPDLMVNKYGVPVKWAGIIPSLVPLGTMLLTPFFGNLYDKKGKGASIMMLGAFMLIFVHTILYIPGLSSVVVAAISVIVLGVAFSLVPSAMWPSVPKIIPEKQLGTAYALIFWIQNIGLWGIPLMVGVVLDKMNPTIVEQIRVTKETLSAAGHSDSEIGNKIEAMKLSGEIPPWDYSTTWLIFVGLTILALVFALLLKAENKRKGYGLELPNTEM